MVADPVSVRSPRGRARQAVRAAEPKGGAGSGGRHAAPAAGADRRRASVAASRRPGDAGGAKRTSVAAGRRRRPFVVAIDGPAGAGKSTVARAVARALRLAHLDTGAMYRALTAKALAEGIDPSDAPRLAALARSTSIEFTPGGLVVDGIPAGKEIRSRRVSNAVSAVSAHPAVRRALVRMQRRVLERGDIVAEGRDIGTVVAPQAPVKIFLTASIDERARRRHKELSSDGATVGLSALRREIARRDRLDSTRAVSPLTRAQDAVVVDSTGKTPRQVVAEIVRLAREARERR